MKHSSFKGNCGDDGRTGTCITRGTRIGVIPRAITARVALPPSCTNAGATPVVLGAIQERSPGGFKVSLSAAGLETFLQRGSTNIHPMITAEPLRQATIM